MPDYQKGKIYKIWDKGYNKCYIGSTCEELNRRMAGHRKKYKAHQQDGKVYTTADMLFDEFGIENCKIELVETFPCNSKAELHAREGHYQRETECINKNIAGRNMKQYNEDNRDKICEYNRSRYVTKKEEILKQQTQYKKDNRDLILKKGRQPWTCECGITITVNNKSHHLNTSKHQRYINQMNQPQ